MPDDIAARIDAWLALCPDPANDPFIGMEQAGLFGPEPNYSAIAVIECALVERTGLLGVASAWGGRQLVGRHFIEGFGTQAQRAAWRGRGASVAISEPGAGAHPKLLTTRAIIDGETVRITGEKAWVSNGPSADVIIVFAITAEEAGRKRYGAFLVPKETPGLNFREIPEFHALRPSRHCGLAFDNCTVPLGAQLGPEGLAYEQMALPFRDIEDAVGMLGLLGGYRFLLSRLGKGGHANEEEALSLGGLVALTAVFAVAADAVVASLGAGRLNRTAAVLVGVRVLAAEILARAEGHRAQFKLAGDPAVTEMLADIAAVLSIARGPRQARQARLGAALLPR